MNFNEVIGFCAWTISNGTLTAIRIKKKQRNKQKKLQGK